jgi:iron complex outermembrane receptor protein
MISPKFERPRWGLTLIFFSMCSIGDTLATELDLTAMSLEELMEIEITTASKFPQKRTDAPAVVTVIPAQDIRRYGYRTLADILRSVPGLYVTYDRNYSYVGTRGFSRPGDYNTRLLLLVDGYRMNDNIYDGAYIGSEFILDVDLIERVEFAPGPGSSIYGSNAFFGVINVVTKTGQNLPGTELTAGVGSDHARRGRISHGAHTEAGWDILASVTGFDTEGDDLYFPEFDDPATTGGGVVDQDSDRGGQVFAKIARGPWVVSGAVSRRVKKVPTAAFFQVFNQPGNHTEDEQMFLQAKYEREIRPGIDLFGTLYHGRYNYDGEYVYDSGDNFDIGRGRWWGSELRVLFKQWQAHKFLVGGEYHKDPHRDQKVVTPEPYFLYLDDHRQRTSYAVYIQDEWAVSSTTLTNFGIRRDGSNEDTNATSPRFALVHRFTPRTVGKFLYGRAFRSPNAYEKYYVADSGYYKANPDLRHEKIDTSELVLEQHVGNHSRLTGSVFSYSIDDLITLQTDPIDNLLIFQNTDQVRAKGAELVIEHRWQQGTNLRASTSWQHAQDERTGQHLPNSPHQIAKLNLDWPIGREWHSAIELQYVSQRATPFDGIVDSYTVANLTVGSQRLWKNLDLSVSLYNLTDTDYADPPSEEHVDSLGRNLTRIRQDGQNYHVKLIYRF